MIQYLYHFGFTYYILFNILMVICDFIHIFVMNFSYNYCNQSHYMLQPKTFFCMLLKYIYLTNLPIIFNLFPIISCKEIFKLDFLNLKECTILRANRKIFVEYIHKGRVASQTCVIVFRFCSIFVWSFWGIVMFLWSFQMRQLNSSMVMIHFKIPKLPPFNFLLYRLPGIISSISHDQFSRKYLFHNRK